MSAVIVFDSSEANCTESIHDEIWKNLTLTQFHTYHFLEIQIVGVSMRCTVLLVILLNASVVFWK